MTLVHLHRWLDSDNQKQPRRFALVLLLWVLEMAVMTGTYYMDKSASDEEASTVQALKPGCADMLDGDVG